MTLDDHDEDNRVAPEWLEQHAREYAKGDTWAPELDRLFGRLSDREIRHLDEDDPRLFDALEATVGYRPSVFETGQWLEAYRNARRQR